MHVARCPVSVKLFGKIMTTQKYFCSAYLDRENLNKAMFVSIKLQNIKTNPYNISL